MLTAFKTYAHKNKFYAHKNKSDAHEMLTSCASDFFYHSYGWMKESYQIEKSIRGSGFQPLSL